MKTRPARGLTLVEMMMVVAIIGSLASLALPNFVETARRAKRVEQESVLRGIETSVKTRVAQDNLGSSATYTGMWNPTAPGSFDRTMSGWKEFGIDVEGGLRYAYRFDLTMGTPTHLTVTVRELVGGRYVYRIREWDYCSSWTLLSDARDGIDAFTPLTSSCSGAAVAAADPAGAGGANSGASNAANSAGSPGSSSGSGAGSSSSNGNSGSGNNGNSGNGNGGNGNGGNNGVANGLTDAYGAGNNSGNTGNSGNTSNNGNVSSNGASGTGTAGNSGGAASTGSTGSSSGNGNGNANGKGK